MEEAIDEVAELEKKAAAKSKKKKPEKKKPAAPEEEGPPTIPGEIIYSKELRDLVKTERFDFRMQHINEISNIKRGLDSNPHIPNIPSKTLEAAIFLPQDEQMSKAFMENPYPPQGELLFKNPFPPVKKAKGKKKKK